MNVSKVSVSRRAPAPHFGHVVSTNSGSRASGEPPPSMSTSSGRSTGSCPVGNRDHSARMAVHDWDGTAPVALARHAPVVEPVVDPPHTAPRLLEPVRHPVEAFAESEAGVLAGIDDDGVLLVGPGRRADVHLGVVGRGDDLPDRESVVHRELVVALVVARHRHDSAGPVAHEDEVRDPHRQALAVERIDRVHPERHAALLHRLDLGGSRAAAPAFLDERGNIFATLGDRHRERGARPRQP